MIVRKPHGGPDTAAGLRESFAHGGSGIVQGSQHSRDCKGEHIRGAQTIRCAGYDNPRVSPDYGPRDKRVSLRACRHYLNPGCPADRCLEMIEDLVPDDGEIWYGTYIGRPFGERTSHVIR